MWDLKKKCIIKIMINVGSFVHVHPLNYFLLLTAHTIIYTVYLYLRINCCMFTDLQIKRFYNIPTVI